MIEDEGRKRPPEAATYVSPENSRFQSKNWPDVCPKMADFRASWPDSRSDVCS
jgi:hypothetical protein